MKRVVVGLVALAFVAITGCLQDEIFDAEAQLQTDIALIEQSLSENGIDADTLMPSEIRIVVTEEGTGEGAKFGDSVIAHYTGYLLDGTEFDSSDGRSPLTFVLQRGDQVIPAWDIAFEGLKKGAKATFWAPSGLCYGQSGSGSIPPNSVLIFDVEVVDIRLQN
ncbi:FKBP-type peptidyl-prolyl cis-trans isomerase [Roseivirga pacifica]|uniref:FKBP-type peptidyl-prolyl cis-trans isomerase n=1 Tax=Roseivirga pacifica TaxID=1267423 RepID=UPI002094F37A|nr:FKBP-type peptidyl-prolyl cis-trans isomerase [Roseivirga pacifica]MCO6359761.1 hypothetical protein [Roseivirga pacifica]MCO6367131.1 hypothetical protein [Roseivirga pacifica]MCO6370337.1 hypothetical protein [Roseivirga pacifica]MCO6374788.1 hypothetical protein [Roseivirga pacifica]MCO6380046.1 hypothetical protein [Roseivirga pacifica]